MSPHIPGNGQEFAESLQFVPVQTSESSDFCCFGYWLLWFLPLWRKPLQVDFKDVETVRKLHRHLRSNAKTSGSRIAQVVEAIYRWENVRKHHGNTVETPIFDGKTGKIHPDPSCNFCHPNNPRRLQDNRIFYLALPCLSCNA